ncbi:hypothetical protein K0B96_02505 [Horticoccus luteus]|uniref:Uncharacterized protein n=1 Tax=Horticoccus luteus TaxID=2862869 RepID=A0A8F9XGR2_9BACT|nr:hypothetical protein [Horticoccus luteus]QYM79507.1 hypothetical protein K0B96_02505 [Horticoccus luteus]
MKIRAFLSAAFASALFTSAWAQSSTRAPEPPVPVVTAPSQGAVVAPPTENQRLYGADAAPLVSREAADNVVRKFRATYATGQAPRVVIYVNRQLVDFDSGLKLTKHTEYYDRTETKTSSGISSTVTPPAPAAGASTTGADAATNAPANAGSVTAPVPPPASTNGTSSATTRTSGQNTYTMENKTPATLADRQTVRDVERLFGRVFRNAGARLADQKVATDVLGNEPGQRLVGTQAAQERAALSKVADIAVEVLISSRNLTVPGITGAQVYTVPDIQATAIRLSDAAIVGQASASDILGRDQEAARLVRQFDVNDITEAVALALLEDMTTGQ